MTSMAGQAGSLFGQALLFGIFAFHHSLFARERVKHAMTRAVPPPLLRSVYVWVASILLSGLKARTRP